jgi:hypothetical protein
MCEGTLPKEVASQKFGTVMCPLGRKIEFMYLEFRKPNIEVSHLKIIDTENMDILTHADGMLRVRHHDH